MRSKKQYGIDPRPRRPFSAYFEWAEERKKDLMHMEFKARQELLGNEWKSMSNSERNIWKAKADEDMKVYDRELEAWLVRHPEERAEERESKAHEEFVRVFFFVCYTLKLVEQGEKLGLDERQAEILAKEFICLKESEKVEWHNLATLCEMREQEKEEVINVWQLISKAIE